MNIPKRFRVISNGVTYKVQQRVCFIWLDLPLTVSGDDGWPHIDFEFSSLESAKKALLRYLRRKEERKAEKAEEKRINRLKWRKVWP